MSPLSPCKISMGKEVQTYMTILEICALSTLVVEVIRLIIDILNYRRNKKD